MVLILDLILVFLLGIAVGLLISSAVVSNHKRKP